MTASVLNYGCYCLLYCNSGSVILRKKIGKTMDRFVWTGIIQIGMRFKCIATAWDDHQIFTYEHILDKNLFESPRESVAIAGNSSDCERRGHRVSAGDVVVKLLKCNTHCRL